MSFWWRCCSSSALPCSQPTDRAHNGCIGTINSLLRTHTHTGNTAQTPSPRITAP
jgi:hypothetical protein